MNTKKINKNTDSYRFLGTLKVSNNTKETALNNNDLVLGSSGSGKTGGYVIPLLQNANESLVISDTKGLLYRHYAKSLTERGYKVAVIDFVNPQNSIGYNPFDGIRRYEDGSPREQDIVSLANLLIKDFDSKEPFWQEAARGYLAMLIAYAFDNFEKEELTLSNLFDLHGLFQTPDGRAVFDEYAHNHPSTFATRKYRAICSSLNADKMWGSINEFVNRGLEPYIYKESKWIFSRPSSENLNLKELGRQKYVLFLNVSDTDRSFDAAINILHGQLLHLLCEEADAQADGKLRVPVRIVMDDFATNAVIPHFDNIISVIRSREISVSLIIQSLSQLETMYGPSRATTIINNCDHILFLGTQDENTAKFIGLKAGRLPEAVLTMPRDKAYIITSFEPTKLVDKIPPYSTL